jgi:hypothetical protein
LGRSATGGKKYKGTYFLLYFKPVTENGRYGPGVDSASNRNKYQEYLLGGKDGLSVGLTNLPPSCANCLDIWCPKLLEPSRPVQACKRIALLLPF